MESYLKMKKEKKKAVEKENPNKAKYKDLVNCATIEDLKDWIYNHC